MKRFRFPLRPVAILRAHRETRAREAFGVAVHGYVTAEEDLSRTRVRMRALEAALFEGRQERYVAAEAALLLSDYRRECAAEGDAERRVVVAREEMQRRRDEYLEAHRQLEVVNRLEQKARVTYRRDNDKADQAEMDDLAGHRHSKPLAVSL